tara:strand:+ start:857 stop:1201 length:345 start_codon:yes stop_codon:yes gene_type:complete
MAYVYMKIKDIDLSNMLDRITEMLYQEYDYPELTKDIIPQLLDRIDYYHTDILDKHKAAKEHVRDMRRYRYAIKTNTLERYKRNYPVEYSFIMDSFHNKGNGTNKLPLEDENIK